MTEQAISEFDLHLFSEGNHQRIYDKLGAHPYSSGAASGTRFAVWAPNAERCSVVGSFNQWDGNAQVMRPRGSSGIWELSVPAISEGTPYKYEMRGRDGGLFLKADPYGVAMQLRPNNCSIVMDLNGFQWHEAAWLRRRAEIDPLRQPFNAYEVHLGSWRRPWDQRVPPFTNWLEAADQLIPYAKDLGYTHLELMGIAEHPLEAIEFLRQMNNAVHAAFPGVLSIAEESTSFPGVTRPPEHGGLGFNFKWNMGWTNDTLRYMSLDPVHRRYNHKLITFSFVYAWSENFILPISHDEVVHGKGSLIGKMPGDEWQKRANVRLLLSVMCAHPGKKLLFMGSEFGQWPEWRDDAQLEWQQLESTGHGQLRDCARQLNRLYLTKEQFYRSDCDPDGFQWLDMHNAADSVWAFARRAGQDGSSTVICVFNATPVPRAGYEVGVAHLGRYRKLFDSDAVDFGGSGYNLQSEVEASSEGAFGHPQSLRLNLPPLGAMFFAGP